MVTPQGLHPGTVSSSSSRTSGQSHLPHPGTPLLLQFFPKAFLLMRWRTHLLCCWGGSVSDAGAEQSFPITASYLMHRTAAMQSIRRQLVKKAPWANGKEGGREGLCWEAIISSGPHKVGRTQNASPSFPIIQSNFLLEACFYPLPLAREETTKLPILPPSPTYWAVAAYFQAHDFSLKLPLIPKGTEVLLASSQ